MATIQSHIFKCPVCNTYFEDHIPIIKGEFIYFESDLRPRSLGTDPVPYQVHSCPFCHFTAEIFPEKVGKDIARRLVRLSKRPEIERLMVMNGKVKKVVSPLSPPEEALLHTFVVFNRKHAPYEVW